MELYTALLDASPPDLLGPLVEASGGVLVDARREDVAYRPGRDAHLRFAATVERAGVAGTEGWVVCAGDTPPAALALESPLGRVAAWRVRDDPQLPGLRAALDRTAVSSLLGDLGLPSDGLALELLAYRPQRRAVVAVRTTTHHLFLKCVPPDTAQPLHQRHVACRAAGVPAPAAVASDAQLGLVVLTPVVGTALRPLLLAEAATTPPVQQVLSVLDAFAGVDLPEPARSPLRQAKGQARLLRAVLPEESARLDDLLAGLAVAGETAAMTVGVHGDFYDDQLLVQDGSITGVVDVDGAGTGHPADDAANLLAHLLVLQSLAAPGASVRAWLAELAPVLTARHEPVELHRRTAAVLLGLCTWPHSRHAPGWQEQTRDLLALTEQVLRDGV